MRFNTFDSVAKWYEATKPVISKNHTREDDVRPISERRYTWKRIKKYDDNCYALLDGDYHERRTSADFEKAMAPILWTRDPESGDTFIRVRNGNAPYAHIGRYQFLKWYLPSTMRFVVDQSGMQVIKVYTRNALRETADVSSDETYELPKTRYAWNHNKNEPNGADDGVYLTFKCNEDGTFTRHGEKITVRTRDIDLELKSQWKPRIKDFYMFMASIVPLLDHRWSAIAEYRKQIDEWREAHAKHLTFETRWGMASLYGIPKEIARSIVTDTEHELRVAVVALIAYEIDAQRPVRDETELRTLKSRYNRVMNKFLQMQAVKEI